MKQQEMVRFVEQEMMREGEVLDRAEEHGPFVVALVELEPGGYELRVAQPAVVYGRRKSTLPDVNFAGTWGSGNLQKARREMNRLVDNLK